LLAVGDGPRLLMSNHSGESISATTEAIIGQLMKIARRGDQFERRARGPVERFLMPGFLRQCTTCQTSLNITKQR
jgi:hypothetical protein